MYCKCRWDAHRMSTQATRRFSEFLLSEAAFGPSRMPPYAALQGSPRGQRGRRPRLNRLATCPEPHLLPTVVGFQQRKWMDGNSGREFPNQSFMLDLDSTCWWSHCSKLSLTGWHSTPTLPKFRFWTMDWIPKLQSLLKSCCNYFRILIKFWMFLSSYASVPLIYHWNWTPLTRELHSMWT